MVSEIVKRVVSRIIFISYARCSKCLSPALMQARRRWHHDANRRFSERVIQTARVFDASSQFLDIWGGRSQHIM